MNLLGFATWSPDWAWGFPFIVLSVVIHVLGLGFINEKVDAVLSGSAMHHRFFLKFSLVMGIVAMLAIVLHGIEAAGWAFAYLLLGALPDTKSAMLYSLGAMTTYGHNNIALADHWQLLGGLEALNGMLLFGLTTAFLFAMIQHVWPAGHGKQR